MLLIVLGPLAFAVLLTSANMLWPRKPGVDIKAGSQVGSTAAFESMHTR
jgi:hypothetical protein